MIPWKFVAECAVASSPLAIALLLAPHSGGFFITEWGIAAIAVFATIALIAAFTPLSLGGWPGRTALAGWLGLAAWQGISSTWASQPSLAFEAMSQTLFYGGCFALSLIGARSARHLVVVLHVALLGSFSVCAMALGARLLPELISGDTDARLSHPITYWNGLGVIAAFTSLLAIALAARPASPVWVRATCAALAPAALTTLLLTYSRGAILCLVIGLIALLALARGRLESFTAVALIGAVAAPLLIATNGNAAIASMTGQLPPHAREGQSALLILLIAMAVTALLVAAGSWAITHLTVRGRRRVDIGGAVAAAIAALALLAMAAPNQGYPSWANDQFASFKSFDTTARSDAETVRDRIAVAAGSGRWQNWTVAVNQLADDPLIGSGTGEFRFDWADERPVDLHVINAHSLYLETGAESGTIGLLLLAVPLGAVAWVGARTIRNATQERTGLSRDAAVVIAAGFLFALHAAGDWDWQLPTTVLPALALGAALIGATRSTSASTAYGSGLVSAVALLALLVTTPMVAGHFAINDAKNLARQGSLTSALSEANRAARLHPTSPEPHLLRSHILVDLNRPNAAASARDLAYNLSPRSPSPTMEPRPRRETP